MNLFDWSALFLLGFAALSFIDGVVLHLWKFRLHGREGTRLEHLAHTARAVLFVPTLLLVLAGTSSGLLLWLGVAVLLADVVVTVADVLIERRSRAFQRGLPRYEALLHYVLTALHAGAILLSLAARPASAWLGTTTEHLADAARAEFLAVHVLLGGSILIAGLHVALMHPRFRLRTIESIAAS